QIDSFWETFNSSRCKTAMLLITILVFLGVVVAEVLGTSSAFLHECAIIILGYWSGRSSKAKENAACAASQTNTAENE
ncbi:MAG: hypothetical protein WCQ96_05870, partial [Patescibacteria group bacterium]